VERPDGTTKGYPKAIGSAISPTIPTYFNSVALCEITGVGATTKRVVRTVSTALIECLKSPATDLAPQLPVETALADFFKKVRS